ncbi:uncharacterized protein LOC113234569 [Hyposmocoma kahamanoa]|uniref:uncharacterized protein LOC113234569 n=1 Tax=Hyposmocoma kahamanoa TaxID=1477025 RepID=UPI000E6D8A0C|nr:uncharacterized protein LOC113234569 [Hyposmocoma kahamanoa]
MSVPALRQPKFTNTQLKDVKKPIILQPDFVILTLRNKDKLVVSSDAYHGILTVEMEVKCVFCKVTMDLDFVHKENHKKSSKHLALVREHPFIETFSQNLIKQLNCDNFYCTICNVMVTAPFLKRHIMSEVHMQELQKAEARALNYTPS